jgi:hypothetical protein
MQTHYGGIDGDIGEQPVVSTTNRLTQFEFWRMCQIRVENESSIYVDSSTEPTRI